MKLHILGSSSSGNGYILEGKTCLIIECGVPLQKVKEALNFDLSKVASCLITHSHLDHCKFAKQYSDAGIDVCSSVGTLDTLEYSHRMRVLQAKKKYTIGEFMVMPFAIEHDAPEPFGYLIQHPECGLVLFLTDTMYCRNKFPGLNQVIIECNYSQDILNRNDEAGETVAIVRNHVLTGHMSLDTCKDFLRANDLTGVNNIVLIHLSDSNSNAKLFKSEIEGITGKQVFIADKDMIINFDKNGF